MRACRYKGVWSRYLDTRTWASSPGPGRPRSLGSDGVGHKVEHELPRVTFGRTAELHPLQPRNDLLELFVLQLRDPEPLAQRRHSIVELLGQRQKLARSCWPRVVTIHAATLRNAIRTIQTYRLSSADFLPVSQLHHTRLHRLRLQNSTPPVHPIDQHR